MGWLNLKRINIYCHFDLPTHWLADTTGLSFCFSRCSNSIMLSSFLIVSILSYVNSNESVSGEFSIRAKICKKIRSSSASRINLCLRI